MCHSRRAPGQQEVHVEVQLVLHKKPICGPRCAQGAVPLYKFLKVCQIGIMRGCVPGIYTAPNGA